MITGAFVILCELNIFSQLLLQDRLAYSPFPNVEIHYLSPKNGNVTSLFTKKKKCINFRVLSVCKN